MTNLQVDPAPCYIKPVPDSLNEKATVRVGDLELRLRKPGVFRSNMRATCLLILVSMIAVNAIGQMSGGWTDPRPPDPSEEDMLSDLIKSQLSRFLGRKIGAFKIISVQTQVVAGTNYRVLIRLDTGECMTVTIFQPLPHVNCVTRVVDAQTTTC